MAEVVNLPKLGFDAKDGKFINWVKQIGDTVKAGDVLAEIENDKATFEIESRVSGTLIEQLVKPGDVVAVGTPIARIQAEGGAVESALRGDRPATYRLTFACLTAGIIAAIFVGLLLLSLRQPLTTNASGDVNWSLGILMVPLAGVASVAILAWSVFYLPVVLARRRGIVLDPEVWPLTGAIAVGVVVLIGFFLAIFLGII